MIDQIVLLAPFIGAAYLLDRRYGSSDVVEAGFWAAFMVVVTFYNLVTVGLFATTAGKAAMGLRVVGPNGRRAGWSTSFRRWMLQLVLVLPLIGVLIVLGIGVVSVVLLFRDPRRQTVHDRVAGSFVVTASSLREEVAR